MAKLSLLEIEWFKLMFELEIERSLAESYWLLLRSQGYSTLEQVLSIPPETWQVLKIPLLIRNRIQYKYAQRN